MALACKTETLGSLHSHAPLILTESSESENQVVHEQKFKDLLSSTCLGLFPLGVAFSYWIFFVLMQ